ncbi:MAG: hypothetical protein JEZ02_12730 [Desulfatibacillum sp.]|nr:hypothetical protein [Desulfatibacillum sp.]
MPVNDQRGYALKPNAHYLFWGLHGTLPEPVHYQINGQGLREDGLVLTEIPENRLRIATLGDSEVFGWSVNSTQTFQHLLEKMDDRLEVINMGAPGYNAENVAWQGEIMLEKYACHAVLYWVNPNDFFRSKSLVSLRVFQSFRSALVFQSYFFFERLKENREKRTRYSLVQVERMKTGLLQLSNICDSKKIPLFLAFSKPRDYDVLIKIPELKRAFKPESVLFIDSIMKMHPRVDGHLSAAGHGELASFLYREMAMPLFSKMESIKTASQPAGSIHSVQ